MAHILKSRVAESTTTTGTDPVALAGALVGHQTYSSVCSVGDTTEYVIYAADAYGFPSGEWEEGIGTYSGTNVLTRTTPKSGSSALPVNFSSGTKVVIMTPLGSRVGAIPRGGSANQVLSKATGNDLDLAWVDPSASITIDANPTDGSSNAVSSNGVFDALAGKADTGHNHSGVYDPAGTASSAVSTHVGLADPHTQYALESSLGDAATKNVGTTTGTVAAGDHTHTAYAGTGAIGSSGLTMATAKLLGRSTAGTGAPEEITLGTNLAFSGTTLNAAGGSSIGERRHAYSSPYSYAGTAPTGTADSASGWTIARIHVAANGTTTVTHATGAWADRATLTYT